MFGRISRRDPQERMVAVHLDNGIDATSKDTIKTDRHRLPLYVGIDVGSSFVHGVVVDCQGDIVCSLRPITHFANPLGAVAEAWHDIINQVDEVKIVSTAFTGSGAKAFPLAMPDVVYLYDSVAIPKGAARIDPLCPVGSGWPRTRNRTWHLRALRSCSEDSPSWFLRFR